MSGSINTRPESKVMIKRILVGIADTTYTASATCHAIELAQRCGASLTGVSILDIVGIRKEAASVPLGGSGYTSDLRKAAFEDAHQSIDEAVDRFVRLSEEAGVDYDFQKVSGDPFLEFIERSKYHDLMICGLHRLFEHGVLPEPKNELAKLVAAGVRPIIATAAHYRKTKKVLVAYSNSVESAKTMRRFTQLSQLLAPNAEVQIVSFGKQGGEEPAALTEARRYMQAHGIEAEIEFIEGGAITGVLDQAESWNADLIVMGNSAKNLLRRQVFGETALHTISNAEVPLFLAQ